MLFGAWTVLGPGRPIFRLALTIPAFAAVIGARQISIDGISTGYLFMLLTFFAIACAVMWPVAKLTDWRIFRVGQPLESPHSRRQFSLKYLLAFITIAAVLFGLARFAVDHNWLRAETFDQILEDSVRAAIISLIITPTLAIPLVILSARVNKAMLLAAPVIAIVLTSFATYIIWRIGPASPGILRDVLFLQLGATIVSALSAFIFRFGGYRLQRHWSQYPTADARTHGAVAQRMPH
jgi:hypothetical protein